MKWRERERERERVKSIHRRDIYIYIYIYMYVCMFVCVYAYVTSIFKKIIIFWLNFVIY